MDLILGLVDNINSFLWNFALLFLLSGTGIYFTVKLKFVQITRFKQSFKRTFSGITLKTSDGMTSFQSLATAIAAQVGTGNLAGAAAAMVSGGAGAIFWMWVSAFFGMATIFAEATAAQKYKTTIDGTVTGGPVYYIRAAFKGGFGKVLAGIFAIFIIIALGFMGTMTQSNSIALAFKNAFGTSTLSVGLFVGALSAIVFLGGMKRIASVSEKVVPFMAGIYILGSLSIILMNYQNIIPSFMLIFESAFNPSAALGGVVGITVRDAIRYGVARGIFSNEAGMGSTPHAHAVAKVKHPCDQGLVAMMGVFIDTFVILTLTALTILTTGAPLDGSVTGTNLTQMAFASEFGDFGTAFVAICLLFFAFTSIIGWYFFAEANVRFLFGKKFIGLYAILVVLCVVIGAVIEFEVVWSLMDMFNGVVVIPNLIGLLALGGTISKIYKNYKP